VLRTGERKVEGVVQKQKLSQGVDRTDRQLAERGGRKHEEEKRNKKGTTRLKKTVSDWAREGRYDRPLESHVQGSRQSLSSLDTTGNQEGGLLVE